MPSSSDSEPTAGQRASYTRFAPHGSDVDPIEELLDAFPEQRIELYDDAVLEALGDIERMNPADLDRLLADVDPIETVDLAILDDAGRSAGGGLDYEIDPDPDPTDTDRVVTISKILRVIRGNDELLVRTVPSNDE